MALRAAQLSELERRGGPAVAFDRYVFDPNPAAATEGLGLIAQLAAQPPAPSVLLEWQNTVSGWATHPDLAPLAIAVGRLVTLLHVPNKHSVGRARFPMAFALDCDRVGFLATFMVREVGLLPPDGAAAVRPGVSVGKEAEAWVDGLREALAFVYDRLVEDERRRRNLRDGPAPLLLTVDPPSPVTTDRSYGLSAVLAATSALFECPVPDDVFASGEVDKDGCIKPIGIDEAKVRAIALSAPTAALLLVHPVDVEPARALAARYGLDTLRVAGVSRIEHLLTEMSWDLRRSAFKTFAYLKEESATLPDAVAESPLGAGPRARLSGRTRAVAVATIVAGAVAAASPGVRRKIHELRVEPNDHPNVARARRPESGNVAHNQELGHGPWVEERMEAGNLIHFLHGGGDYRLDDPYFVQNEGHAEYGGVQPTNMDRCSRFQSDRRVIVACSRRDGDIPSAVLVGQRRGRAVVGNLWHRSGVSLGTETLYFDGGAYWGPDPRITDGCRSAGGWLEFDPVDSLRELCLGRPLLGVCTLPAAYGDYDRESTRRGDGTALVRFRTRVRATNWSGSVDVVRTPNWGAVGGEEVIATCRFPPCVLEVAEPSATQFHSIQFRSRSHLLFVPSSWRVPLPPSLPLREVGDWCAAE